MLADLLFAVCHKGVLNLFESGENHLLVTGEGLGLARVLYFDGRSDTAGIENRPAQRRAGGPGQARSLGQVGHIQALRPQPPGQGQPRKQVGGRHANPRGGRLQFPFGPPNIGTPA